MKAVVFDPRDWENRIWPALLEQHGKAIGIREVCKRRLGFTVRYHTEYVEDEDQLPEFVELFGKSRHSVRSIRLDFDDEQKKLLFMMKWCG